MSTSTVRCRAGAIGMVAALTVSLALPGAARAQQASAPADDGLKIAPIGYLQFDLHGFPDWELEPGTGRLNRDRVELRRLRTGIDGRWKRVSFEVSIDPLDDEDDSLLKDAYGEVRLSRRLALRVGQFKLPGTKEYLTSARTIDFMERTAMASSIAAGRDYGMMARGRVGRVQYQGGVFGGDGRGRDERAGLTAAGRVVWEPRRGLELGGYASDGRVESTEESQAANGSNARAPSGYRFFDRLYVAGRRQRLGGDVEWTRGRWRATVEALRVRDDREEQGSAFDDLPSLVSVGFSAATRVRIGAGRHFGVRYEYLGIDDSGPETSLDSVRPRASDVRARSMHAMIFGTSLRTLRWARLMGNAGLEWYPENRTAPESGKTGPYLTIGTRLQIELPWRR